MQVLKPIGAKLYSDQLPSQSYVNVEVVEGSDGIRDLCVKHSVDMATELYIAISDLIYITEWAQKP